MWFTPVIAGVIVAVAALTFATGTARAQGADAKKKAQKYFMEGEREYTLGNFKKAIEDYRLGFESFPDQWFLFNIAQSYRQLDDCKNALFFYKRFLAFAKRPESARTRKEAVEKEVRETFIPDLNDKCKRDQEVREKPPDFVEGPKDVGGRTGTGTGTTTNPTTTGTGTGTGTTTNTTTSTGTTTGTGTATKPDDKHTQVAQNGDDDDDTGDDDDDDMGISTGTTTEKPSLLVTNVAAGPSFLSLGVTVPTQLAIAAGGGYPLHLGPIDVAAGALFTYTPIAWKNLDMNTSGTASLTSILANGVAFYEVMPKLNIRAELGLGVQLFGGLGMGNPFTLNGSEATGALGIFNVRVAVGAEYALTKNLVVSASPAVFSYSPAPANMNPDMNAVTRFEILIGAGYRM